MQPGRQRSIERQYLTGCRCDWSLAVDKNLAEVDLDSWTLVQKGKRMAIDLKARPSIFFQDLEPFANSN